MIYLCDCPKKKNASGKELNNSKQGRGVMGFTSVDSEEICVYCGHYAATIKYIPPLLRGKNKKANSREKINFRECISYFYKKNTEHRVKLEQEIGARKYISGQKCG